MQTPTYSQRVARNVRAEMVRAGRIQSEIAGRLGISQQSLSRRLSGATAFSIDELAAIADSLDVRLTVLLGEVAA